MRYEAVRRIERALGAAAAFCLMGLMLLVTADVAGRDFLNRPLPGATELAEILLAGAVFLVYPSLAVCEAHITVDLIRYGARARRLLRMLAAAVGLAVFGLIAWCVAVQALRVAGYGDTSAVLGIPMGLVLGGMGVFAGLTALGCLLVLADAMVRKPAVDPNAMKDVT